MTTHEEATFEFAGADGAPIAGYRWAGATARGIVQLVHGMGEHARRYHKALAPLIEAGFVVYANDHRGHGRTARSAEALGDFGPGGYDAVVADMAQLTQIARAEHAGLPTFLLGHSMGSMLGQGYLLAHSDRLAGAAFSGSAAVDHLSAILSNPLGLEALNVPFQPARTPFDWLSRDPAEVDAYITDPLCSFALCPDSMLSLFAQGERLADPSQLKQIRRGFPLYIFAGAEDPVNAKGAWIEPLIARYRDAGLDVTARIYDGARHEVLNETNWVEVVGDLLRWLDSQVQRTK